MEMNSLNKKAERKRLILMSDIHYCNEWYGITPEIKRDLLCADLEREYEQDPYDALLLLGDYSLDHWAWDTKGTYLNQGISNTKLFIEHCLHRMAPIAYRKLFAWNGTNSQFTVIPLCRRCGILPDRGRRTVVDKQEVTNENAFYDYHIMYCFFCICGS